MIIRNDDVAADTTLREIKTFCELCDRYGVTPMHAITPIGRIRSVDCKWTNAEIRERTGTALFSENAAVVEYLKARVNDLFAVHGLWHTHEPSFGELRAAAAIVIEVLGRDPIYHVPPFNEGYLDSRDEMVGVNDRCHLEYCGAGVPRLEEFLESGDPAAEIVYLHSWRFEHGPFTWDQLDRCLKRLTAR